jgi:hypothetical protein
VLAAVVALALLGTIAGVTAAWVRGRADAGTPSAGASGTPVAGTAASSSGSPSKSASPEQPADERCTDEIKANPRWVCLKSATFDGLVLTIEYSASFADASPNVSGGYHLHVYGGDGTDPVEDTMGRQAADPGHWYVEDANPSVRKASGRDYTKAIGDAPKVCARIANAGHRLVKAVDGGFHTGNCVPITRT